MDGAIALLNDTLDNNNNGVYNEPGEKCLLTNTMTYYNSVSFVCNASLWPTDYPDYYGYLHSFYPDSTHLKDTIYCSSGPLTNFHDQGYPYQHTLNYKIPSERRMICGSGPFLLNAKDTAHYATAFVFTQDSTLPFYDSTGFYPDLFLKNLDDIHKIKNWYANNNFPSCHNLFIGQKENYFSLNEFKIYPNPSQGQIKIETTNEIKNPTIQISDMLGRLIYGEQKNYLGHLFEINLAHLTTGLYFVNVSDKNGLKFKSQKILVQR